MYHPIFYKSPTVYYKKNASIFSPLSLFFYRYIEKSPNLSQHIHVAIILILMYKIYRACVYKKLFAITIIDANLYRSREDTDNISIYTVQLSPPSPLLSYTCADIGVDAGVGADVGDNDGVGAWRSALREASAV